MPRRLPTCLAAAMLITSVTPAFAWGVKGHDWILRNAVDLLPDSPLKTQLVARVGHVRWAALTPDFEWKDGSHADFEYANHYFDLEYFGDPPTVEAVPRTRLEALRYLTRQGLAGRNVGFLPYRIEEMYLELVNAMATGQDTTWLIVGALSHYAADATQPLHSTIHFDGRADERVDGRKAFAGIHMDYEADFIEDHGLEFFRSSRELADGAEALEDVRAAALAAILEAHAHVDEIYAAATVNSGDGKYADWDESIGPMTRLQMARGATFAASLWLTAWEEAGRPDFE